jgi:hypothetical protein
MLVVFGALLAVAAVPLALREISGYRHRDDRDDLFVYSRARLVRRVTGMVVLAAAGVTLLIWDLAPPDDPGTASLLLGLVLIEVVALVVIAILDMRETSRTARIGR